jgi:hypothetical protein
MLRRSANGEMIGYQVSKETVTMISLQMALKISLP